MGPSTCAGSRDGPINLHLPSTPLLITQRLLRKSRMKAPVNHPSALPHLSSPVPLRTLLTAPSWDKSSIFNYSHSTGVLQPLSPSPRASLQETLLEMCVRACVPRCRMQHQLHPPFFTCLCQDKDLGRHQQELRVETHRTWAQPLPNPSSISLTNQATSGRMLKARG